jgi:hypothetical protein
LGNAFNGFQNQFNVSIGNTSEPKIITEEVTCIQSSRPLFSCERDFPFELLSVLPFSFEIAETLGPTTRFVFSPEANVFFTSPEDGQSHRLEALSINYVLSAFIEEAGSQRILATTEPICLFVHKKIFKKRQMFKRFHLDEEDFSSNIFQRLFCSCSGTDFLQIMVEINDEEVRVIFSGERFASKRIQAFRLVLISEFEMEGKTHELEVWDSLCLPSQEPNFHFFRTFQLFDVVSMSEFSLNEYQNKNFLKVEALFNEEYFMRTGRRMQLIGKVDCDCSPSPQIDSSFRSSMKASTFKTQNLCQMDSIEELVSLPFAKPNFFETS